MSRSALTRRTHSPYLHRGDIPPVRSTRGTSLSTLVEEIAGSALTDIPAATEGALGVLDEEFATWVPVGSPSSATEDILTTA